MLEKIIKTILVLGIIITCGLIIYFGITNLIQNNYTSLGDPYYSNNTTGFERAPAILISTLFTLLFALIEVMILATKKPR